MKIITHPSNREWLKEVLRSDPVTLGQSLLSQPLEVIATEAVEKERRTDTFKMPSGKIIPRSQVKLKSVFWEYGPEDIEYLKFVGVIEEVMESVFYVMKDDPFPYDPIPFFHKGPLL